MNINDETSALLRELAETQGTTVTEIVRRATGVYKYFHDRDAEGKEIQVVDAANDKVTDVKIL
ncbi:hypothetical protein [Nocardioides korecus]